MHRSLWAVLAGTFSLRFSTGLTGAMLGVYLAELPDHGGPEVSAITLGVFGALFYLAELVLSPIFGILSDRQGHHRVMLYGPVFGAVAVIMTGLTADLGLPTTLAMLLAPITGSLVVLGLTRDPRRCLDRGQHPIDPGLHRDVDRRRRAAAWQGIGPLRGRDVARARGRVRRGAGPVRGVRTDGVLPERRSCTAARS